MKICTKCRCELPIEQFNTDKSKKDGLTSWCKICVKKVSDNHYNRNKVVISDNRKAKHAANPEHRKEYFRNYYENNKSIYKRCSSRWSKANRHKCVALWHKREKQRRNATPPWSDFKAIEKVYKKCQEISKATGIPHHVDHIVPISGMNVCGLHVDYNLRIIPASENLKKGRKLIPELCGAL